MRQSFLRKVTGGILLLLAGLTQVVTAQQAQTEAWVITKDVDYTDVIHVKELIINGTSENPTDTIDISLRNNSTIETITVESGKAKIHFTGDENITYTLGTITIAKDAELTLLGSPQKLSIQSVSNEGRFTDETGVVQEVKGTHSFAIEQAGGYSMGGALSIYSKAGKATSEMGPMCTLQKKENNRWKDEMIGGSAETINFGVTKGGIYRLKWMDPDEEDNVQTVLHSKEINLLQIEEQTDLKDVTYDAIALHTGTLEATKVSMDNVAALPCTTEENSAGFSVGTFSNLELTLKGTNSRLGTLRNYGTMALKNEGDATFEETTIYNEGIFTDETGNEGMILGPAGLWIQEFKPNKDNTGPDGTQIKSVSLRYAIKSFYRKVIVETYQNGQWVNYDEIKGGESKNESPELRSTQGSETEKWTLRASYIFTTAVKGTYRFKIETTKDNCKTTWYSKPYELIESEYEIKDDQLELGTETTTILPSLLITAGKDGVVKDAILNNIEIPEHAVETPSVNVEPGATVNLTLKGKNDLGSILLAKGSTITLKPETAGEDMNEKLSISSVRNGGSFTDETATVSSVKDLSNHTMIEFTDTIIYQIENAISVSLRAVGNSLDGGYWLLGDHKIEKFDGEWKDVQSKSQLRADTPAENPNHSAEVVINLTTTETGIYRMKVTSTHIDNKTHNATLYFMFEIANLEDNITIKTIDGATVSIDGTSEEYKNANMLLFANNESTESPVKVTLNNVQLKEVEEYEEYTSSVVAENQNYELTLNGDNDLAAFIIEKDATATLKKGDSFKSLNATVYNGGKFIDETGTIQQVVDLDGLNMLSITGYGMTDWNGYSLVAYSDFFFGDYEVSDSALEHLVNGEWIPYHNSVMRSVEGTPEGGAPDSHECAYTYTGLETGQYRIKVYAEKWTEGAEFGKANHAVTLYHHFTITGPAPEPEPTYCSITLPSVKGITTSPTAGTYWESEGSSFSFSLKLDPDYDQSQPIVKVNDTEVTPDGNGTYTISSIYENITITIEGITENTPTGNAVVEENGVKIWTADRQLHLSVPSAECVWIYAFNGSLIRSLDEVAGDITVNLNKGSYIIIIGEKRYKVAL